MIERARVTAEEVAEAAAIYADAVRRNAKSRGRAQSHLIALALRYKIQNSAGTPSVECAGDARGLTSQASQSRSQGSANASLYLSPAAEVSTDAAGLLFAEGCL